MSNTQDSEVKESKSPDPVQKTHEEGMEYNNSEGIRRYPTLVPLKEIYHGLAKSVRVTMWTNFPPSSDPT